MKRLFACDTPLQLFNVCNQQFHEREAASDLIIVNHFEQAHLYGERLRKIGMFRQSCVIQYDSTLPKNWLKRKCYNFQHFFFIEHLIRKALDEQHFCDYESYDVVAVSYLIETSIALIRMNPKAKIVLYEDGLGSYGGNLITDFWSNQYKFFSRVFRRGCFAGKPEALYVNNPECCRTELSVPFLSLPPIDKEYLSFAENIFGKSVFPQKKIILLSQPVETGISKADIEKMVELLKPYAKDVMVRMHPRDCREDIYSPYFETVRADDLWELIAFDERIEDKILISIGSTAQFVPKILFDREPGVVFLYPFSDGYSSGFGKGMKDMIDVLKDKYRTPKKICVPSSLDEVSAFLDSNLV